MTDDKGRSGKKYGQLPGETGRNGPSRREVGLPQRCEIGALEQASKPQA